MPASSFALKHLLSRCFFFDLGAGNRNLPRDDPLPAGGSPHRASSIFPLGNYKKEEKKA